MPDEEIILVYFNTEVFELKNCEQVDEDIYKRSDLMTADIEKKIEGDQKFHKPGTKLEFSVNDIKAIKSQDSSNVYYSVNEHN